MIKQNLVQISLIAAAVVVVVVITQIVIGRTRKASTKNAKEQLRKLLDRAKRMRGTLDPIVTTSGDPVLYLVHFFGATSIEDDLMQRTDWAALHGTPYYNAALKYHQWVMSVGRGVGAGVSGMNKSPFGSAVSPKHIHIADPAMPDIVRSVNQWYEDRYEPAAEHFTQQYKRLQGTARKFMQDHYSTLLVAIREMRESLGLVASK